jgi:hypothetical protein
MIIITSDASTYTFIRLRDMSIPPVFGAVAAAAVVIGFLGSGDRIRHRRQRRSGAKLTVVGDIFCDVVANNIETIPSWGEDSVIRSPMTLQAGGSGLNTAVWLHNISHHVQVTIAQTFSQKHNVRDPFSKTLERAIEKARLRLVSPFDKPSACAENEEDHIFCQIETERIDFETGTCICLSGDNDRSFRTFRGGNGVFKFSDLDLSSLVPRGTKHVPLTGYFNCPGIWGEESTQFIRRCRKNGVRTISLNPQFGAGWGGDIENLIPMIDFFICNQIEAQGISKALRPREPLRTDNDFYSRIVTRQNVIQRKQSVFPFLTEKLTATNWSIAVREKSSR